MVLLLVGLIALAFTQPVVEAQVNTLKLNGSWRSPVFSRQPKEKAEINKAESRNWEMEGF